MACSADNNTSTNANSAQQQQTPATLQQHFVVGSSDSALTDSSTISVPLVFQPAPPPSITGGGMKRRRSRVPDSLFATAVAMFKVFGLGSSTRRTKTKGTKANKVECTIELQYNEDAQFCFYYLLSSVYSSPFVQHCPFPFFTMNGRMMAITLLYICKLHRVFVCNIFFFYFFGIMFRVHKKD